jgi:hypothetical protein
MSQASVNHQMLAIGLPKILDELNYIANAVHKEISIGRDSIRDTAGIVVELYTLIFDLLTKIMHWCEGNSRGRVWKSLKRDCYQEFETDIRKIDKCSTWISRDTQAETARKVDEVNRKLESMQSTLHQFKLTGLFAAPEVHTALDQKSTMDSFQEALLRKLLEGMELMGQSATDLLIERALERYSHREASSSGEFSVRRRTSSLIFTSDARSHTDRE